MYVPNMVCNDKSDPISSDWTRQHCIWGIASSAFFHHRIRTLPFFSYHCYCYYHYHYPYHSLRFLHHNLNPSPCKTTITNLPESALQFTREVQVPDMYSTYTYMYVSRSHTQLVCQQQPHALNRLNILCLSWNYISFSVDGWDRSLRDVYVCTATSSLQISYLCPYPSYLGGTDRSIIFCLFAQEDRSLLLLLSFSSPSSSFLYCNPLLKQPWIYDGKQHFLHSVTVYQRGGIWFWEIFFVPNVSEGQWERKDKKRSLDKMIGGGLFLNGRISM